MAIKSFEIIKENRSMSLNLNCMPGPIIEIEPFEISFLGIKVKVPKWAAKHLIYCFGAIIIFLIIAYLIKPNFVQDFGTIRQYISSGSISSTSAKIDFAKTFLFWVPKIESNTAQEYSALTFSVLHAELTEKYGGWTRWNTEGQGGGEKTKSVTPGYFYQVSTADENTTTETIRKILQEIFGTIPFYVVETPYA